jgi:ribonuclease P protein component
VKLRERLKESEFKEVFKSPKKYYGRLVVLFVSSAIPNKVGFVASKKVGDSVERNRARRLMRESFLRVQEYLSFDESFVLIARASINGKKMDDVLEDIKALLHREVKKYG